MIWANGFISPGASKILGRPLFRFMINGSVLEDDPTKKKGQNN